MSTSEFLRYEYKIMVDGSCELFDADPFYSELCNVDSLLLASEPFSIYKDCVSVATKALSVLASFMEQVTERKHIIFSKTNPNHTNGEPSDDWDSATVCRLYISDEESFKNKTIEVTITADINVVAADLQYLDSLTNKISQ